MMGLDQMQQQINNLIKNKTVATRFWTKTTQWL